MPFTKIRGIGSEYGMRLVEIRQMENLTFESFVRRSKDLIPRDILEDLIFAGAFDFTGYNKNTMISSLDGLFEFDSRFVKGMKSQSIFKREEFDFEFLKNKEYELLGFNSKYHPIIKYQGTLPKISDIEANNVTISIASYLTNLKIIKTKSGDSMASFYLEDEFTYTKGVLFSKDYYKCAHYLENNTIYELTGNYKENRGELQFIVRELRKVNV